MARIINGKEIAAEIRAEVASDAVLLKNDGIVPHLSVILVGENPASQVYVKSKTKACQEAGISSETILYPKDCAEETVLNKVRELNSFPNVHGILVQLPLPNHIDEQKVIETINPDKDIDGFHPVNMGKLASGMTDGYVSCTPAGIIELFIRSGITIEGKRVVIVGRSNIVGKPVGLLLLRKGPFADATVTFCHSRTKDLTGIVKQADIIIAAVGRPHTITKDMVRKGAVIIDVGMNRIEDNSRKRGYRLAGDVDFAEVESIASAITPVPGGVGPMTIAMLLKNTITAATRLTGKE